MSIFLRHHRPEAHGFARTRAMLSKGIAIALLSLLSLQLLSADGTLLTPFSAQTASAAAGINPTIHYQGKVSAINGAAVSNGTYNMRFKIYGAATGGTTLWTETWSNATTRVTMTGGLFSVALGTHQTMTGSVDFNSDSLYLQVEFDPGNDGVYEETFSPRRRFSSVPYAHNANTLDGLDSSKFVRKDQAETLSGSLTINQNGSPQSTIGLKIIQTASGAHFHAEKTLSSSGTLVWEGSASGASLWVSTFEGAGLTDCDLSTSVVRWDATTKRFSCGTVSASNWSNTGALQTAFDARYVNTSGDTMTGALTINVTGGTNATIGLKVINQLSGSYLHAEKSLSSSGSLVWEGAASGATLYLGGKLEGAGLTDCDLSTQALKWDATTGRFSCGTVSSGNWSNTGSLQTAFDNRYVNTSGDTMTGALTINMQGGTINTIGLKILNTFSGAIVQATQQLRSSGTLTVKGSARFQSGVVISRAEDSAFITLKDTTNDDDVTIRTGSGSPHGIVSAQLGSLFMDNSTGKLYRNNNGSTQWVELTSGSGSMHMAKMTRTVAQSIGDASFTRIAFDTEEFDVGGIATQDGSGGGNDRFDIKKAGLYLVTTSWQISNAAVSYVQIYKNGAAISSNFHTDDVNTTDFQPALADVFWLVPGDYIEMYVYQDSTGAQNTATTDNATPRMSVIQLQDANGSSKWTASGGDIYSSYSGEVGIGTTRPGAKLSVSGAVIISANGQLASASVDTGIALEVVGTMSGKNLIISGTGSSTSPILFTDQTRGALGINTITPGAALDVRANLTFFGATRGSIYINDDSLNFAYDTNGVATGKINELGYLNGSNQFRNLAIYDGKGNSFATFIGSTQSMLLGANGSVADARLEVIGTVSGAVVYAKDSLRSSGSLVWEGAASGATLYLGGKLEGAGLTDCDLSTQALKWDATTGRFSCGTVSGGSAFTGTGALQGYFDNRYVNTSGDTMTGALTINVTGGNNATIGLKVINQLSGSYLHAEKSLTSSGALTWEGAASGATLVVSGQFSGAGLTDCDLTSSKLLWDTTTKRFSCGTDQGAWSGTGALQGYFDNRYVNVSGDTMTGALVINVTGGTAGTLGLRVLNTVSGAILHAERTLTSSGQIVLESSSVRGSGALTVLQRAEFATGAYIHASGAALLALDSYTQRHSSAHIVFGYRGNFDTALWRSTGSTLSLSGNLLPGLTNTYDLGSNTKRWRDLYLSGSSLHIGSSTLEGRIGYRSAGTEGMTFYGSGGAVRPSMILSSGGLLGIGTTGTPKTKLEVIGTVSGSSIAGFGLLSDCSNGVTSKLLWNATTKRFSCGTDQGGGSGISQADADDRYVNTSGDTMTGNLLLINDAVLVIGSLTPGAYNAISDSAVPGHTTGGEIEGANDLFLEGSLEVDGKSFFDGTVFMAGPLAAGGAGAQSYHIFSTTSTASHTGELGDANDMFIADDLEVDGTLFLDAPFVVGNISAQTYNILSASATATHTSDITAINDLFIEDDLEVDGAVYLDGSVTLAGVLSIGSTSPQSYNTIANGATSNHAGEVMSNDDLFIADDLEVDGTTFLDGTLVLAGSTPLQITTSGFTSCTALETDGSGNLTCGSDDGGGSFSYFNITDSSQTSQIDNTETITFVDGTDINVSTDTSNNVTIAFTNASGYITGSTGNTDYVNVSGDTMNGTLIISASTPLQFTSGGFNSCTALETDSSGNITCGSDDTGSYTLAIGNAVTSGTPGSVLFIDVSGNLSQSNSNFYWDYNNNRLAINRGGAAPNNALDVGGTVWMSGTLAAGGVSAQSYNILSSSATTGHSLDGSNDLFIEDDLEVDGTTFLDGPLFFTTASGSSLTLSGLLNCDTLDTDASGNVVCGTDSGGGGGMSQVDGDARYVNTSGDTMTGALVINVTGGTAGTLGLRVLNTVSGAILHAERALTSSGQIVLESTSTRGSGALTVIQNSEFGTGAYLTASGAPILALDNYANNTANAGIVFGNRGTFDTTLYRSAAGRLQTDGSLYVLSSLSGSIVHAEKTLSSSGSLMTESGAYIGRDVVFSGTRNHSLSIADSDVSGGRSLTLRAGFGSNGGGVLNLIGGGGASGGAVIISGGDADASDAGGSVYVLGGNSSVQDGDVILVTTVAGAAQGNVGIGTVSPGAKLSVSGAVLINANGNIGSSSANDGVALEIIGTASGRVLRAQNTLASSGTLVWEGFGSGARLHVSGIGTFSGALRLESSLTGATIFGFGLPAGGCSNATTSKLLWDAATGKFSCGTDQSGGVGAGSAWSNTGSLQGYFDNRYVNTSGDTMTGALVINVTGGTAGTLGLRVLNTVSGAILHAERALTSSGQIVLESSSLRGSGALTVIQKAEYGTGAYVTASGAPILALDTSDKNPNTKHIVFGYRGNFDTNLYRDGASILRTDAMFVISDSGSGSALKSARFSTDNLQLSQLEGGLYFGRTGVREGIFDLANHGVTWTARDSNRNWLNLAMSSDGKLQTAVAASGQIYTSSDYGVTWTARDSSRSWTGVAMGSDGKIQTAVVSSGQIYTSSDYGATWTARDSSRDWRKVAMSSDGKIQAATVYGGMIYTSSDYGANWTARDSSRSWRSVAMSSDGKIQTAAVESGRIYTSADYGATWTFRDSVRAWQSVAMSSDGKIQTAVVEAGQIYTSSDYGATWTARDSSRDWSSVAMSSDGKIQAATVYPGQLYTSSDYGATWTARDSSRDWTSVAMSSDGKIQAATVYGGMIYTSSANAVLPYGSLGIGTPTVDSGIGLEVVGVASGSILHAQSQLRSSGSVVIEGSLTGATIAGFGLSSCSGSGQKLLYNSSTQKFFCGTDRASFTRVKLTSQTFANTTLTQVGELGFPMAANETWSYSMYTVGNATTTADWKFAMSAPTNAKCTWGILEGELASSSGSTMCTTTVSAGIANRIDANGTKEPYMFFGTVFNGSNAGNLDLYAAQAVTNGTSIIYSGSYVTAFKSTGGADYAEVYYTRDARLEAGDVVRLDPTIDAGVLRSNGAYDRQAVGIVSTQPGMVVSDPVSGYRPVPIALAGRVPVKVSMEGGLIAAGDYLAPSSQPGIAMRATRPGRVIGVAMEAFDGEGIGRVLTFVNAFTNDALDGLAVYEGSGSLIEAISFRKRVAIEGSVASGALLTLKTSTLDGAADVFRVENALLGSGAVFRLTADGNAYSDGTFTANGADYAEYFYASTPDLAFGELVCLDVTRASAVKRCSGPADPDVIGIVSSPTQAAFIGNRFKDLGGLPVPGTVLVGLLGQLQANVVVENEDPIRIGDQLTPSSIPGFARKAVAGEPTVGVAMENLPSGQGKILVLVARKNSSLTADAVSDRVLQTIKDLQIDDEIALGVQEALNDLGLEETVRTQVDSLLASSLTTVEDRLDTLEARLATFTGATLDQTTLDRIAALETRLASYDGNATGTASTLAALTAETLSLERTLSVGTDARIAGDLYLDGAFHVADLFIPGTLTIDGTLKTNRLEAGSGSTFFGKTQVAGDLEITGRLLFSSGSTLSADQLLVKGGLAVIGDVTVDGIAMFLKDLHVKGELIVSNRQAGYAQIPRSGTAVTVLFSTGFTATPVVTASPDVPVPYAVSKATATGFTIRIGAAATEAVTFSWLALSTQNPLTAQADGNHGAALTPFPVDSHGVPLSSNAVWNACIRGVSTFDDAGQPLSCSRYHDRYTWQHPDLNISFLWNTALSPPLLVLPDGYLVQETEDPEGSDQTESVESSASSAASSMSSVEATQSSSASSEAAADTDGSSSSVMSEAASAASSTEDQASSAAGDASSMPEAASSAGGETVPEPPAPADGDAGGEGQ